MGIQISDPSDQRLDDYRSLRDHGNRRRQELAGGFFIVEGWEAVSRLIASRWEVRSVLVAEDKAHRVDPDFETDRTLMAPRWIINEVVGFDLHRGVVASAVRTPPLDWRVVADTAICLAVLEGINDQENLGAVFRAATALGVDGALLAPCIPDPLSRRTVRVSMGAVVLLPFARIEPWPAGLTDLKAMGFTLVGMTPDVSALDIESVAVPDRPAILVGSEALGLSLPVMALVDVRVRIRQMTSIDSLNVGHASAIAFHRFGRVS